jgi:hypothetical protein
MGVGSVEGAEREALYSIHLGGNGQVPLIGRKGEAVDQSLYRERHGSTRGALDWRYFAEMHSRND